jgi:hypothetical protein
MNLGTVVVFRTRHRKRYSVLVSSQTREKGIVRFPQAHEGQLIKHVTASLDTYEKEIS